MLYFLGTVAMGIKKNQTSLGFDILDNEIFQKRRFAHTSFADYVDVKQSVGWLDAESILTATEISFGDGYNVFGHELSINCSWPIW